MERSNTGVTMEIVPFDSYDYVEEIPDIDRFDHPISAPQSKSTPPSTLHQRIVTVTDTPLKCVRRITNFIYCDVFATATKHMFLRDSDDPSNFYILLGELIPILNSGCKTHKIKIIVADITVYYGCGVNDPLRGVWVQDVEGAWYQLVAPCHAQYQKLWDNVSSKLFPRHYSKPSTFGKEYEWTIREVTVYSEHTGKIADLMNLPLPQKVLKSHEPKRDKDNDGNKTLSLVIQGFVDVAFDQRIKSTVRVVMTLSHYEVCYGGHHQVADRGIWVRIYESPVWYRIINASSTYEKMLTTITEKVFGNSTTPPAYDIKSNYYRDLLRRLTYTSLVDEKGKSVSYLINPEKESNKEGQAYFLRGYALPKEDAIDAGPLCVSAYVSEYVVDLGRKKNSDLCIYLKAPEISVWYRIDPKCFSEVCSASLAPSYSYLSSVVNAYNWPSESNSEVWRRIDNCALVDLKGNFASMLSSCAPNKTSILKGQLVRKSKSPQYPPLNVQLYCEQYSIDYGTHVEDESRGLWLKDENQEWYKIQSPHPSYSDYAWEALVKTQKFLKIHETLVFDDAQYCPCDDNTGLYKCSMTICELFIESKGSFDLSFVLENKEFICNNLEGGFDKAASKRLFSSINKLTKKEVQRCEDELELQEFNDSQTTTIISSKPSSIHHTIIPEEDTTTTKAVKKRKTEEVLHSKEAVKLPADNSAPSQSIGLPISNKITKEIIKRVKPSPLDEEDAADEDVDRAKITTSLTPSPNPSVDSRPKVSVAKRKELEEKSHIPSTITEPNIAIVTAPNTPTVEVSTATPSSSSKIIKKRIINVSGHDPLSLPSSEQSSLPSPKPVVSQPSQNMNGVYPKPTKGLKFCPYCKKLEKHHMCSNPLHQPDGYYGESREEIEKRTGKQVPAIMKPLLPPPELKSGEQLCPYCKGLGKKLKCENQYHHDGRPLNKNAGAEDNKSMPVHEPHFKPPDLKRHDEDRKERERYKQKKHETVTISIDSDRQSSMFVWKTSGPDLQLKPKKSCLKKTSCFDMSDDRNESNFHMETGSSTVAKKKVHWIEATARGQLGDTVYFVSEISEDPPTPSSPSYLL